MEVEEMERKEVQAEIPWIPTTPVKPIVPKSAPICTPVEGNSQIYHQANGAFACSEFSHGTEKNRESHHGSVSAATITDIDGQNGKICEKTASDNVSSAESMFPTEVASTSSCATRVGDNNGLNDLVVPSVVSENSRDPHETSDIACCSKRTSQNDPAKMLDKDGTLPNKELCDPVVEFAAVSSTLMENHNPDEGSSLCTGLNKTPEKKPRRKKHRPKVIREGKPKRTPKPATPKPAPSKENTTGKRKYVRRKELNKTSTPAEVTGEIAEKTPEAAKLSCQRSLSFDIGTKDESSAGRENTTALLGKENGVAEQETNFGLTCDLNISAANVKHASNISMSLPEDTQAPDTTSQSSHPETNPKENLTGKKKYARRKLNKTSAPPVEVTGELTTEKMSELAKPPCKSCTNFDKGGMEESSAVKENATTHMSEENIVMDGTNPDLAYDVKTSMKQASDSSVLLTEDTQTINTSSRRKPHRAKPKEGPLTKRQYVRRLKLNKSSTPTEASGDLPEKMMPESAKTSCMKSLNFDEGARDESSADRENASGHPCKETGAAIQEIEVGLGYDVETFMKQAAENNYQTPTVRPGKETGAVMQEIDVCLNYDMETFIKPAAENNYVSFCNNEQITSTPPSNTNPPGDKPKENLTGNKYQRRKRLNKTPTCQTEMTGEQTGAMMPESKETPMRRYSDFDMGAKDESSAHKEIVNVQMADVVEETPVGLAYNREIWIKHALNSYIPLPEDAQAPSKDPLKDNPPGEKPEENQSDKRKGVRKKRSKRASTPREMTDELTEPIMSEPAIVSCRMSINFDNGGRDESNMCNESLASDQNTLVKEMSNSHMSVSENTQAPSTCLPKSNPPGTKRNASNKNKRKGLPTAEDGNISNSQVSTINLQMVGCEREHSETTELVDNNSMNLIGAHYNGLHSYQSKFPLQFPNIQKKRRTEKEKTNTHITSSVIAENGVPLIFSPQYAQVHPYASNYNPWMYGSGYNTAVLPMINEYTENYIHNNQTFDEFRLSLRRATERSQFEAQTCEYNSHYNSLMRIRSCIEPDYTAKQQEFSDWQTIRDAERPQTCIDVLAEDMPVSCAKKKKNRKRDVLSSSAHPNTDEMQQCHNFALVNHNLALGKSSDAARRRKKARDVSALTAQFRQLNINAGEKDLVLYKQNALVPFQGSFDPIKKQRPRPKVDLDEETDRVWKLLLLDINHEGVDGTDEDKAKWWEEERNVFRGRAESFIARMHLVQGDRRFSRWKGSVVDSVVGVFLTQNVSDHLSSSAFMALAARFPKKSDSTSTAYDGEGTRLVNIVEPEENTECDVKLLNQSVCNQSSMTVDIVEHSGNESCRITSSPVSLTDESNCKLTESPQTNITECHSPMVMIEDGEEKSRYGARKELNDIVSSQSSVISSQISGDFSNDQNPEKIGSCSDSNSEIEDLSSTAKYNGCGSFCKLLEMVSSTRFYEVNSQRSESTENMRDGNAIESWKKSSLTQSSLEESIIPSHNSGARGVNCSDPFKTEASSSGILKNKDGNEMIMPSFQTAESAGYVAVTHSPTIASQVHPQEQSNHMQQQSFFNISGQTHDLIIQKEMDLNLGDHKDVVRSETNEISSAPIKSKSKSQVQEEKDNFDWDSLRIKAQAKAGKREKTEDTMDSLDWEALRCADVGEIAKTIKERGMNNRLAERIQKFLNRVVEDHGSIDLEWLRDVPPDQAKEYLLSVRGLGLKSVECVRLLTLHHLAFPVDTNVGRIAVRLGWVPLQPLPESLQLHLLEMYPVLESIQKYLWPRLCKLDQKTLYELHYQMITFGKVFCTKSKPNCNACPMRAECRHFASAFASARLALPGPEQKNDENPPVVMSQLPLPLPENTNQVEEIPQTEVSGQLAKSEVNICQPIIEEPASPEPECPQVELSDIEDAFYDDPCEIPTIELNIQEFTLNLQNYMQQNMELQEGEMSKALVALNPQAASIPVPKLKNVSRLRTEHCVYELPDNHPLLEGWDTREPDDPGKYLLAIWTPGETADSTQAPECKCSFHEECGQLCNEKECFSCNSFREANSQIVRGTLLIPCRTAMRGSFPLNGTYFQVNEVFADHESSLHPVSVPRSWIWNLGRRTVYFGSSTASIFKGLSTQEIQQAFWRGYICVRGFERKTRAPRPLMARLHFPASKLAQAAKEKAKKESSPAKNSQVPNPESTPKKSQGRKPNPESLAKKSPGPKPNPDSLAKKSPEPKPNSEQPELISNSHSLQDQDKGTA